MSSHDQPIVVFKGSPLEANIIRGLLGSEGIVAHLNDELMGMIIPGHIEVRVLVPSSESLRALTIVEEYSKR